MTANVSMAADNSIAMDGRGDVYPHRTVALEAMIATPAVGAVLDDKGSKQGVVEHGGHTDDGRPQIVGTANAGDIVHLYDGLELLGKITVGASGEWSFTPRLPLVDGEHVLSVIHESPEGDISEVSADYVIHVDKVAPEVPVIVGMVDDEGRLTGPIVNEGITDDNQPTIDGTAEANATVIVYDKGKEIGRAQADASGNWSFTPEPPLADGTHILEYVAVDQAGNQSEKSASLEFLVDTRPELANIHVAHDDVGSITGLLVSGSSTDDTLPTLHGTATAGGIVKIYEGSELLGQTVAGVDGRWTLTPQVALSEGAHTLQATVTLPAKGESERSPDFNLVVDTAAPDAPTIDSVFDDVGVITGNIAHGGITDDSLPEFQGKAEAGSTVVIHNNGLEIGRVQADAAGNWTFTPGTALDLATHSITAVAIDGVGNVSEPSRAFEFTVDDTPTQTATLSAIGKDSGYSNSDFLTNDGKAGRLMEGVLSGALVAGQTLQVSTDNGKTWQTALTSGTQWSVQDNNSHAGSWVVQTRVMNDEGSAGQVNSSAVTLDTTAPRAPTAVDLSGANALDVSLHKASVTEGDRIHVTVDGRQFDHVLTADDVKAGKATVSVPGVSSAFLAQVSIVDVAGNSSEALLRYRADSAMEPFNHARQLNIASLTTAFGSIVKETGILSVGGLYGYQGDDKRWGYLSIGNHQSLSNQDVISFNLDHAADRITINLDADTEGDNHFIF